MLERMAFDHILQLVALLVVEAGRGLEAEGVQVRADTRVAHGLLFGLSQDLRARAIAAKFRLNP